MNPATRRFAALLAATASTALMLTAIDGLARHPSHDGRLAALAVPAAAAAANTAALARHGCPASGDSARS